MSLDDFATRLRQLAKRVDEPRIIQSPAKSISLAEIALHSRDATLQEFQSPLAVAARKELFQEAQHVEDTLRTLVDQYHQTIVPQMEQATKLCQETPCGGATWELDMDTLQEQAQKQGMWTEQGNQRVLLQGDHGTLDGTPCGRLQLKSLAFLETTLETKPQVVMASRARILLSLAMELQAPLQDIRKHGTPEQKRFIQESFQSQVLPTPWIRSDKEYESLQSVRDELVIEKK